MYAYGEDNETPAVPGEAAVPDGGGWRGLRPLDWIALIALVAGGVNCGLIAAVNLDVFARVLPSAMATRVAYGLVGLAALHCVVLLFRLGAEDD
ncbi:DUF378 domain-containing protein [Achromobacter sp. UMC71]|uniref:DUF378 domain-containing protein n=1 Tax=Achromobacter sp. UMC71 TaxID=1862320 RepID=UPI001601D5CD|nr:DUF378 domain-containing protein [Achromobacter sp. UMC71]MBB1624727.1 DUF378 domain-containing protein [Achromobacter sp. UMC71]